MYSAEENKADYDFVDTASSDFFHRPKLATRTSDGPTSTDSIDSLQDQLAKLKEILVANQELATRLQANNELKCFVVEAKEELDVVRARTCNEQNNLRMSFEKGFASLERELAAYRKNWKKTKENAEAEMEEQVNTLKNSIKQDQQTLNKALASTSADFKAKSTLLQQQLKDARKARGQSTGMLMGMIQQARVRLQGQTEGERRKRGELDSIVLGLLDRTVDQGEKILRRIG